MKRDIELQKPVAHSSIWLGKRVSDFILKKMFIQKAKSLFIKVKCQKFQASISQWDVMIKKKSNDMKNIEPNEKFQTYVIKLCGRSYMHISIIEMGHII